MILSHRTIICCYEMLHIYSHLLLHLQIAKYKGFLIKIQIFTAKVKVLKDFNKIKGFKGSPRSPGLVIAPYQEANGDYLGTSFQSTTK